MAYPVYMAEGAGFGRVRAVMNPAVFRPGKQWLASAATDRKLMCGAISLSAPPLSTINDGIQKGPCTVQFMLAASKLFMHTKAAFI